MGIKKIGFCNANHHDEILILRRFVIEEPPKPPEPSKAWESTKREEAPKAEAQLKPEQPPKEQH